MKTTTLKRDNDMFNPYFLNGKQVEKMIFFNPQTAEIVFSERWFNNSGSNNQYPSVTFNFDIPKKNIKDLTRQTAFCMSIREGYDKGKLLLYIPISLLQNYQVEKDVFQFETDTDKHYKDIHSFDVVCVLKECKLDENNENRLVYFNGEEKSQTVKVGSGYRSIKNSFGAKVAEVLQDLTDKKVDVKSYALEKIMKHYTLTPIN